MKNFIVFIFKLLSHFRYVKSWVTNLKYVNAVCSFLLICICWMFWFCFSINNPCLYHIYFFVKIFILFYTNIFIYFLLLSPQLSVYLDSCLRHLIRVQAKPTKSSLCIFQSNWHDFWREIYVANRLPNTLNNFIFFSTKLLKIHLTFFLSFISNYFFPLN